MVLVPYLVVMDSYKIGEHIEAKDDMIEDEVNQSDLQLLFLPNKTSESRRTIEKLHVRHWRQENTCSKLLMLLEYCQPCASLKLH